MREIKFRTWDKSTNKMSNPYNLQRTPTFNSEYNGEPCISTIKPSDWLGFDSLSENERQIALQYTGLHDKNGVEIYEGDWLVDANDSSNGGSFVFFEYGQWQPFSYVGSFNGADYEVIGNIYENKELLEEK